MIKINYPMCPATERPLRFADMKIGDTVFGELDTLISTHRGTFLRTFVGFVQLDNPRTTWEDGCSCVFKPGARFVNLYISLSAKEPKNV